jgi:hypothetical protein
MPHSAQVLPSNTPTITTTMTKVKETEKMENPKKQEEGKPVEQERDPSWKPQPLEEKTVKFPPDILEAALRASAGKLNGRDELCLVAGGALSFLSEYHALVIAQEDVPENQKKLVNTLVLDQITVLLEMVSQAGRRSAAPLYPPGKKN